MAEPVANDIAQGVVTWWLTESCPLTSNLSRNDHSGIGGDNDDFRLAGMTGQLSDHVLAFRSNDFTNALFDRVERS